MKINRHRKNVREGFALPRPESICPNCGMPGKHFAPPCFGDPGFYFCPDHVRIPVTFATNNGEVVRGHITGDPDMSPATRNALERMMQIVAERAMNEPI